MATYDSMIADIKTAIEKCAEALATGRATTRYMIRGREHQTNNPAEDIDNLARALERLEKANLTYASDRRMFRVAKIGGVG